MTLHRPELSDLVVAYDPKTLARREVLLDEVLGELARHGMTRAARIVSRWPHCRGVLDARYVDGVLVRSHLELQRLSEEFQQGDRMKRLILPMLAALRAEGVRPPYRIVDVGCGLGYVLRWLAAEAGLGDDVELVGCDYNASLVHLATRLAREERLRCEFVVANASQLKDPATLLISTGAIHHFRGDDLVRFLAQQAEVRAAAFIHSDIKPSWLAPIGSWLFHEARMREPLARHDGFLSALRAHPGEILTSAARRACPSLAIGLFDARPEALPVLKVMQALVGMRPELAPRYVEALGALSHRFEWQP